jgi:NhaP-type Na+/H+ or K+/H+ antiporter
VHESVEVGVLPVLAIGFVLWGIVSARMEHWNVSAPIAFVAAGMALGAGSDPVLEISLDSEVLLMATELTLAVVLFGDAATVRLRRLREDAGLPSRLLVLGLPGTMALGTVAAHLLLPGLSWWVCAVIGASVAPTDAALGAAIMEDERVPSRIRRLLNVESGLNDGIATPFVNFFLVAAVAGTAADSGSAGDALLGLVVGALVGIVVGFVSGRAFDVGVRRGWASTGFVPIATMAVAVTGYSLGVFLDGNGFVGAFVAGLAYRAGQRGDLPEDALRFTHEAGKVLSLGVWFVFGAYAVRALDDVGWREVAFAVVALTIVRMVPVALALAGSGLDRATVAVIGWFGPRGLASVVFALLAAEALPADVGQGVVLAIGITVLLSVVLHGATANPIAARYGATHTARRDDHG